MNDSISPTPLRRWGNDLLASVVVFLVALPLCMGIAIASGVPAEKAAAVGIISGVIGGLLVGSLSGCSLQVSGPAAGLVVIVGQFIAQRGYEALGAIVMVAGAVQILAGLLRVGQWFRAVSPAVIQGMLAGIGVLIFASQFHVMVDDRPPGSGQEHGGLVNLVTLPEAIWKGLARAEHRAAALVGVLTIGVIVGWSALAPKRLRAIPAPLVGVLAGAAVAAIWSLDIKYVTVPDNLLDAISLPAADSWRLLLDWSVLGAGVGLALVASAESLLTATAADAMQRRAPRTRYDRELAAQGAGNLLAGFLGALPITGVIVRTSTNIHAGAQTRAATVMHGMWLLLFAAFLPSILRLIPVASLAAVLVYTGFKLINPKAIKALLPFGRGEVAVYAATLVMVVVTDLLTGILFGIGLALAKLLYTVTHVTCRLDSGDTAGTLELHLGGAATFLRLPKLAAALESIPTGSDIKIRSEDLILIDHACLNLLADWCRQHETAGGRVTIDWEEHHALPLSRVSARNGRQLVKT
jgi:MFS superfamily sulfate permease-like transporter